MIVKTLQSIEFQNKIHSPSLYPVLHCTQKLTETRGEIRRVLSFIALHLAGGRRPVSPLMVLPTPDGNEVKCQRNKAKEEPHFYTEFVSSDDSLRKNDVLNFFLHFFGSVQFITTSEKKCGIRT